MWNPFKKKDPNKEIAGVYHLAETFFPQLVQGYNQHEYEESIFEDIDLWKKMLTKESASKDFRFKRISAVGTDFKNNHNDYIVLVTWPEVPALTSAKACVIAINRPRHIASQYILESSFGGSMVIKIEGNTRMNTGITIPNDQNELTNFTMAVVNSEGIHWK